MLAPFMTAGLAVLAALAPTEQSTQLEASAGAQLDLRSLSSPGPPQALTGLWKGGGAFDSLTLYLRPVFDDERAPPLQPFLQRATRFTLATSGNGGAVQYPAKTFNPTMPSGKLVYFRTHEGGARLDLGADGYWGRNSSTRCDFGLDCTRSPVGYVAATIGLDYARWGPHLGASDFLQRGGTNAQLQSGQEDSHELTLDGSVAAGVRWRALLMTAGWSVHPYLIGTQALRVRFWGGAFVSSRAVVAGWVDLKARVDVLDRGASVDGSATFWLRRRIGLTLGAEGGHGGYADADAQFDRAGGRVAVEWWASPGLAASLAYAPEWQSPMPLAGVGRVVPEFTSVRHLVTLTFTARPQQLAPRH